MNTAAVQNYLVTRADLKDDLVYQMTATMFANLDELVASHSAARAISLNNATKGTAVPFHPGALKYYKEKGLMP